MAVYRGVLHKMSEGSGMLRRTNAGYEVSTNLTRREFIEIGDKHIENVILTNYHDALLFDDIGKEVGVSMQGHRVIAIKLASGRVARDGFLKMIFSLLVVVVMMWILAAVVGGILYGMGLLLAVPPISLIAVAVSGFFVVWSIFHFVTHIRAWAAL